MPLAPRPELPYRPYRHNLWRVIEAQSRVATMGIVDTIDEQAVLERALEETKPPLPAACRHLNYQFRSPFRYGKYPRASRFRRAGRSLGVWYGSEEPLTAVCESIWGALRFYAASPATPMPRRPVEHSAVQADVRVARAVDLTAPEMASEGRWTDPNDYTECLAFADRVRAEGGSAIRYASVRHPDHWPNVAVLGCEAFAQPDPIGRQTWHIMLNRRLVRAACETLRQQHMFVVGETKLLHAA